MKGSATGSSKTNGEGTPGPEGSMLGDAAGVIVSSSDSALAGWQHRPGVFFLIQSIM